MPATSAGPVETGGIIVGEAMIDKSRDSQVMINGAYSYSQVNPTKPIQGSFWLDHA